MKIIFTEKDEVKELGDEELIAENIDPFYVNRIVDGLNLDLTEWGAFRFEIKEDDYVLLKRFETGEEK